MVAGGQCTPLLEGGEGSLDNACGPCTSRRRTRRDVHRGCLVGGGGPSDRRVRRLPLRFPAPVGGLGSLSMSRPCRRAPRPALSGGDRDQVGTPTMRTSRSGTSENPQLDLARSEGPAVDRVRRRVGGSSCRDHQETARVHGHPTRREGSCNSTDPPVSRARLVPCW